MKFALNGRGRVGGASFKDGITSEAGVGRGRQYDSGVIRWGVGEIQGDLYSDDLNPGK